MGHITYLSDKTAPTPSLPAALDALFDTSVVFTHAWQTQDIPSAVRVSAEGMRHLDHVVNILLRARDDLRAMQAYVASPLEQKLGVIAGLMAAGVSLADQHAMSDAGPGNGVLPAGQQGQPITLEKLLNKIKHRQEKTGNFRLDSNAHIFVINVDKPNHKPDSIVEFDVRAFCVLCRNAAPLV